MAASKVLSDKAIKAALRAAVESGKPATINDGGGLSMICRPDGAGWWRLRYWLASRENRLSLGTYPDVSLADARSRCDDARKLVAAKIDPSESRKAEKAQKAVRVETERLAASGLPGQGTFEHTARDWLKTIHEAKVSTGHAERTRIRFEQDVFPWIGRRPIAEIESPELLECIRRIESRGAIETAHRAKDSCGQVFRFGIASGLCKRDPAADLKDALRPVPTRHHAAIVEPKRAASLLRDMAAYVGHPVTRAGLLLSALLLVRPGELRHMEWAWIDLEAALLTVPPEIMKRSKEDKADGAPHLVPLAPQAVAILRELQPLTGEGRYVFPALTTRQRCMSENTVRSALRRMGYGNDDMTAHGFRAMARTMIAERLGIVPEVIEAQLAHAVPDALGRAYNRTQYLEQRTGMMTKWADYVDHLRAGTNASGSTLTEGAV